MSWALAVGMLVLGGALSVWAQTATAPPPGVKKGAQAPVEQGVLWRDLTTQQRWSLHPLESTWSSINADRKLKWIEIAHRMPSMPMEDRERIQMRMTEWAMLSPIERGRVRLNFQEAKRLSAEQRRVQWDAYQALPEQEKRQLADGRLAPSSGAARENHLASPASARNSRSGSESGKKSNITPNPALAQPPTPIAATLVHAGSGATTSLVSKPATPPAHQQVGLPKIVATPQFINPVTLLPRRGPQAVAAYTSAEPIALERP